jgi:hypothetical protein
MRKDITFHFGAEEIAAMENIKDLVTRSITPLTTGQLSSPSIPPSPPSGMS